MDGYGNGILIYFTICVLVYQDLTCNRILIYFTICVLVYQDLTCNRILIYFTICVLVYQDLTYGFRLDCFVCSDVPSNEDCHNVQVCNTETERCFTEVTGSAGNLTFTYGCKEEQACLGHRSGGFVGRREKVADCHQCCAVTACNKALCSQISPIHQTTGNSSTCTDDPSIDCKTISSLFHVCDDVHHAKKVCKKWCGLCELVDGEWGSWSESSGCSVTCGNGTRTRNRSCDNPTPAHGGLDCVGDSLEYTECSLDICPVHGQWSSWSVWTECSTSCGYGITKRIRFCNNPPPEKFGQHCFGPPAEARICTNDTCVVDGGWSEWTNWATCSTTCGIGLTSKVRSCDQPYPKNGGQYCIGDHHVYKMCKNDKDCIPTDNVFTSWSEWFPCDSNIQFRNRSCFVFNDVSSTIRCNDTELNTVQYRPCGSGLG